jgi:hypothetical protein
MKKFQVFLGLAVLVLVLWAAATPMNMDGKSLIAGWAPQYNSYCCEYQSPRPCGEFWGCSPTPYNEMMVCWYDPTGTGSCGPAAGQPCVAGTYECVTTYNGHCY